MMLHDDEARAALGRGVAKLARCVRGTLGPRGMNAVIDRPMGTPIISRDGVAIAQEVELADPFENMGAQVAREVAMQTNAIAGDGTTTATVLADALVQGGLAALAGGANAIELVRGMEMAADQAVEALRAAATPVADGEQLRAVAVIAANDEATGALVAEALERAGPSGIVTVEFSPTTATSLDVQEGMSFDRGYLSHHMVTDVERMQVLLDNPLILMTDLKLLTADEVATIKRLIAGRSQPLLIIAEEVGPAAVMSLLAGRDGTQPPVAAIHPPDYGHWRKSMLEDIAILTGGRVIAKDLGGRLDQISREDLGGARHVRVAADQTVITGGAGDPERVAWRRQQIGRQMELAPNDVDRDKLQTRLARLSGGTATILAGGATPVEQKRRAQLIEDAINAARAAADEGIVPGGGTALLQAAPAVQAVVERLSGCSRAGAQLLLGAASAPLASIATNSGLDPKKAVAQVAAAAKGIGLDVRTGDLTEMVASGIVDPVKVTITALKNAISVAALILTTSTLIAKIPEYQDPTAGAALGGGAEKLGRD